MGLRLKGSTLRNEIVDLDGSEFVDCDFYSCTLRFSGIASYTMIGCLFSGCVFQLAGAAANTIQHLKGIYSGGDIGGKQLISDVIYHITNGEMGEPLVKVMVDRPEVVNGG